jgi:hypothetical protein
MERRKSAKQKAHADEPAQLDPPDQHSTQRHQKDEQQGPGQLCLNEAARTTPSR